MQQECLNRFLNPELAYYRSIYNQNNRWNGDDSLEGKTVIVFGEGGDGDIIQFSRYIPLLKEHNCEIIFHCPQRLHRIFQQLRIQLLDIEKTNLPHYDFNIASMSLPFALNQVDVETPYLVINEQIDLGSFGNNIGIAWEGDPKHSNCDERNCPLRYFSKLQETGTLFSLQKRIYSHKLLSDTHDIDLYSVPIVDYYDTASLINSVDYVVAVDTSVVHLAGAMNKKIYLLLSYQCDPRWEVREWYDNITIVRQTRPDDWHTVMTTVCNLIS